MIATMNIAFLSFSVTACLVKGQDNSSPYTNNYFIYPPSLGSELSDEPTTFTVGSPHGLPWKWASDMSSMVVYLQQVGNPPYVRTHQLTDCQSGAINSMYWNGDIGDIDLENGTQAYLSAHNCSDRSNEPIFVSHYFNLTKRVASEDTSTTSTSTATTTTSSNQSTMTSPIATNKPAIEIISQASSTSLTNFAAAIIGGIGAGIGAAIIIIILVFIFPRTRKHRKTWESQDHVVPAP